MSQNGYDRRALFACEICDLVYAGFEAPEECRVCGSEMFVKVVPETDTG